MISIICVYNDENIFRSWLLQSLEKQTVEYELIALNNAEGEFKSAAQAYNYGVQQTKKKQQLYNVCTSGHRFTIKNMAGRC